MYWYPSVLNFNDSEYSEYDEWIETFGRLSGNTEHIVYTMTFKALTYSTLNFFFLSNLNYTKEPITSNLCLGYLCW